MTFVLDGCRCNSFVAFHVTAADIVYSTSRAYDVLGDVSSLAPTWLSFSSFSMCLQYILFNNYNGNCCSEPFHIIVNLYPVWSSHIRKRLSNLHDVFVGIVFSVCTI
jgi:hypothetical protein